MTIHHMRYGHLANIHFRYLPCLLDREHINPVALPFLSTIHVDIKLLIKYN